MPHIIISNPGRSKSPDKDDGWNNWSEAAILPAGKPATSSEGIVTIYHDATKEDVRLRLTAN